MEEGVDHAGMGRRPHPGDMFPHSRHQRIGHVQQNYRVVEKLREVGEGMEEGGDMWAPGPRPGWKPWSGKTLLWAEILCLDKIVGIIL